MAQTKRAQPATHASVYVGLALAAAGLLLAIYAYTGTRIYDVRFATVALGGALLAVAGIFVSAWGRAIMASRAQRSRRALIHDDALKANDAVAPPPTVAAPPSKRSFDFAKGARKLLQRKDKPADAERPLASGKGAFAFKRRAETPPPPAPAEEPAPPPRPAAQAPVEPPAPEAAPAEPALERVTIRCPRCATESTFEGVRPFPISCPSCGLAGTV